MIWALAFGLIFMNSLQGLSCRMYSIYYPGESKNVSLAYSAVTGTATAAIAFAMNGFSYCPSRATLVLGITGAFFLFATYYALIRATAIGSYSFYSICGSFGGTVIPLLVSVFFYGETFRLVQIWGIAISLVSFVFFNLRGPEKKAGQRRAGFSSKYVGFCVLGAVTVGIYNQLISTHQILLNYQENTEMVVTVYLAMAVICMLGLFAGNGRKALGALRQNKKSAPFLLFCCMVLPVYMSGVLVLFRYFSPAVFYVVGNSGSLVLAAVYSRLIFKEQFTPAKLFGIGLAIGGAVLLGL